MQLGEVILGKERQLKLALACVLAKGHLLIEDVPGVGKTTLAAALAATLGLRFSRVQFTSDLLPADLLGASVFERDTGTFRFHEGPVFTNVLLADEINRASPRTQSALLEAMEERQVSESGVARLLPTPFFVLATQNPSDQSGTFALPESQLDRFLMVVTLGYPDPAAERELLAGRDRREIARHLPALLSPEKLLEVQAEVDRVHVAPALLDYVQTLLRATREGSTFMAGLSPRAGLSLLSATRAWAWLSGRDHALPQDVHAVFAAVATHRLLSRTTFAPDPRAVTSLLEETPIP